MSRALTLAGFAVLALAAVSLQLAALRRRRFPTLGQAAARATRAAPARAAVLAGWLWLGWHLFARSGHP